jgi:hypothetical protein
MPRAYQRGIVTRPPLTLARDPRTLAPHDPVVPVPMWSRHDALTPSRRTGGLPMDQLRERLDTLESPVHTLTPHTHTVPPRRHR